MSTARLHVTYAPERGRLLVRWACPDVATWHAVLTDFKACFSRHHERTYLPGERAWSLPLRCRRRLVDWADCWFSLPDQRWDDDPQEAEEEPAARAGGPPPGGQVPSTLEEASAVLFLRPGAPGGLVEAAYRWWSKELHPDRGGDEHAMVRINRAMEVLRAAHRGGRRSA